MKIAGQPIIPICLPEITFSGFRLQIMTDYGIRQVPASRCLYDHPFGKPGGSGYFVLSFILGSSLSLHAYRVSNIKKQNIILETKVRKRTDEVVQQKEQILELAAFLQNANNEIIRKNIHLEFQKDEIERQAGEIRRMNYLLQRKNEDLTLNVQELSIARVMQKRVTYEEFREIYPNDESCLALLRELKEPHPFICKNCHNSSFSNLTGSFYPSLQGMRLQGTTYKQHYFLSHKISHHKGILYPVPC